MGIFFRTNSTSGRTAPSVPRGYRVYAIGDVHGRADLLDVMLARIDEDIAPRGKGQNIVVFLGDLIDRGPASADVIERVRTYGGRAIRRVALVGNHEEVLLRILRGDAEYLTDWLRFGGAECLASYGVDSAQLLRIRESDAVAAIRAAIPPEHRGFLESLADTFQIGGYMFVHAGLRPGIPLSEQNQTDLRWIREPFLECEDDHGFVVVHGHTITSAVEIRDNRIGLDTGAYRSGVLSALGLERDERWFLEARDQSESGSDAGETGTVASQDLPW